MICYRQACSNVATALPALLCTDKLGGSVMWAMGVPHCQEHTTGACVDAIMTGKAWTQLCGMIRKEGLIPPGNDAEIHFIPLEKFSLRSIMPEVTTLQ